MEKLKKPFGYVSHHAFYKLALQELAIRSYLIQIAQLTVFGNI